MPVSMYVCMCVNMQKIMYMLYISILHYLLLSDIIGISIHNFYSARHGMMTNNLSIKVILMHRDGRHCS